MSDVPLTLSGPCLNCGRDLSEGTSFCPQCGQRAGTGRLTWAHVARGFVHAFLHADKGIFHLWRDLALRPGTVAREYLAGQRQKYFNPFMAFLLSAGLVVALDRIFGHDVPATEPDPALLARLPTDAARASYAALLHRSSQVAHFAAAHANVFALAAVPILAAVPWLVYRRRGYNYVEWLTAVVLFESFTNLVVPLGIQMTASANGGAVMSHTVLVALALQAGYVAFALNGLLRLTSAIERLGALAVAGVAYLAWFVAAQSTLALYVLQNRQFYRVVLETLKGL